MVTMRSRQLLFFAGRDEGAGDLIILEGEDTGDVSKHGLSMQWIRHLAHPLSFNSPLETTFG
jgi:hypothetical protein